MIDKQHPVTIVGAGLAGSLLTILLAKRGYSVEVIEKRPDPRGAQQSTESAGEGRSINLALSTRGLFALDEAELSTEVTSMMIPMRGRALHSLNGERGFAPYGKNDREVINSISRNGLNSLLVEKALTYPNVHIHFDARCLGYDFSTSELHLREEKSGKQFSKKVEPVIGTDGAASAIRLGMLGSGRFNFSQSYLAHGYKELTIPAARDEFQMEPHALHIWPRGGFMMIALPNPDRSFTCTLFFPFEGSKSFSRLETAPAVRSFFEAEFPDAVPLLSNLETEFLANPTGSLITVKCFPWHIRDQVLLLGDASHAIVPFYGQGMNCAFEDCSLLCEALDASPESWETLFSNFGSARKKDTDAIADLAIDNFIEMRDTSANPLFPLKKQVEHLLEEKFPDDFISKYSMVSFHRIPYSIAMHRGRIQDAIIMREVERARSLEQINLQQLYNEITHTLKGAERLRHSPLK